MFVLLTNNMHVLLLMLLLMLLCCFDSISSAANVRGEGCGQPACVKCDERHGCVQCVDLVMYGDGTCVTRCPAGSQPVHHHNSSVYSGPLCRQIAAATSNGRASGGRMLPMRQLGVVVALLVAAAVGVGVGLGLLLLSRLRHVDVRRVAGSAACRSGKTVKLTVKNKPTDLSLPPAKCFDETKVAHDLERVQFITRLHALRPEMQLLLNMVQDTKRDLARLSHQKPSPDAVLNLYRAMDRNLRWTLSFLHRREDQIIDVPSGWRSVFDNVEHMLNSYKRDRLVRDFDAGSHVDVVSELGASSWRRIAGSRNSSSCIQLYPHADQTTTLSRLRCTHVPIPEEDELTAVHISPSDRTAAKACLLPLSHRWRSDRRWVRPASSAQCRRDQHRDRTRHGYKLSTRASRWPANSSVPAGLDRLHVTAAAPIFVHHLNGRRASHPSSSSRTATSVSDHGTRCVIVGDSSSLPAASCATAACSLRPTYMDWPVVTDGKTARSSHRQHQQLQQQPRPRAKRRRRRASVGDDSANDSESTGSQLGAPPPPPAPVFQRPVSSSGASTSRLLMYGSREQTLHHHHQQQQLDSSGHSDYIERDVDSNSSSRCFSEERRTAV